MTTGLGFSQNQNSYTAGNEAAEQAVKQSGKPILTFLFTTEYYDQRKVFEAVKENIGESKLIGACVPGIIAGENLITNGIGVYTVNNPSVQVTTYLQEDIKDSYQGGVEAGKNLKRQGFGSGTVFIFPDGFAANISHLLRGLYSSLGPGYDYIGGGSGDNLNFYRTYQFTEKEMGSNSLAVALVKGINFQQAVGNGWKPTGKMMSITKAKGKVVSEIDGMPAFERYSEVLGGIQREEFTYYGMKHPLGIPHMEGSFLIRDPLSVKDDNSIEFVTEVPQNTVAMLMDAQIDDLINTAKNAAKEAKQGIIKPEIAVLFDCVSRYLLMGERFKEEIAGMKKEISGEVPFIGVLSFGEISSVSGIPFFYNKSVALVMG